MSWTRSIWVGIIAMGAPCAVACEESLDGAPQADAAFVGCLSSPCATGSALDAGLLPPSIDAAAPGQDASSATGDAGSAPVASDGSALNPPLTPPLTPGDQASDLPCDVQAIVSRRCGACHGANGVAPTSLERRADFLAASKRSSGQTVAQAAMTRLASTANGVMMPPASSERLSAAELTTLNAWLAAGAPAGEACAPTADAGVPPVVPPVTTEEEQCFKLLAHDGGSRTQKYRVGRATDAYINMSFAAPWGASTRYAVALKPIIDNARVLHHWLLFEEAGVDGAVLPGSGAHPGGKLVTGWAPGGNGVDLRGNPDDVGYEMPGGGYVLEFHYNSSDPNAEDASGVEICLMDRKPKNIAAVSWLGADNLVVPSDHWTGDCHPASSQPIHIVAVSPHMHKTGRHMTGTIHRANGSTEMLHDGPFDFDYQTSYPKDVVLNPGDWIRTDCYYSQLALFGESTGSEMCYLFTVAYPKGALQDLGAWGAVAHGGSSCLQ